MAFWVHVEKGFTIFIVYLSGFKSLESLESLARLLKKVSKTCETFKIQDFANATHDHSIVDYQIFLSKFTSIVSGSLIKSDVQMSRLII